MDKDKSESDNEEIQHDTLKNQLDDESSDESIKSDSVAEIRKPRKQYTREKLLELRNSSEATKRPLLPDIADIVTSGTASASLEAIDNDFVPSFARKRLNEPDREPIRRSISEKGPINESSQGVVLGPQRPRFGTGCHVAPSLNKEISRRPSSPPAESDNRTRVLEKRDLPPRDIPQRRVGSGRLAIFNSDRLPRDRELRDDDRDERTSLRDERSLRDDRLLRDDRSQRDDRLPRDDRSLRDDRVLRDDRSFRDDRSLRDDRSVRDERMQNDRFKDLRSRDRFRDDFDRRQPDRRQPYDRDNFMRRDYRQGSGRRDMRNEALDADEPEWFTEGPSSQLETIELVGFEADERRKRQQAEAKVAEAEKKATEIAEKKDDEASKKDDAANQPTSKEAGNVPQSTASPTDSRLIGNHRPEPEEFSLPKEADDFDFDINQFIAEDFGDDGMSKASADRSRAHQWFHSDLNIAGYDGNDSHMHSMEMTFLEDLRHSVQSPSLANRDTPPTAQQAKAGKPRATGLSELFGSVSAMPGPEAAQNPKVSRAVEDQLKALIGGGAAASKIANAEPMKKPMTAAELEAALMGVPSAQGSNNSSSLRKPPTSALGVGHGMPALGRGHVMTAFGGGQSVGYGGESQAIAAIGGGSASIAALGGGQGSINALGGGSGSIAALGGGSGGITALGGGPGGIAALSSGPGGIAGLSGGPGGIAALGGSQIMAALGGRAQGMAALGGGGQGKPAVKAKTLEELEAELVSSSNVKSSGIGVSSESTQRFDPSVLFSGGITGSAAQPAVERQQQQPQQPLGMEQSLSIEQQLRHLMTADPGQGSASLLSFGQQMLLAGLSGGPGAGPVPMSLASIERQVSGPMGNNPLLPAMPMRPPDSVSPRPSSPIMFGSRPPVHLAAPMPVMSGMRPPMGFQPPPTSPGNYMGIAQPVPALSQQELAARNQAILQNAIARKRFEEEFIQQQHMERPRSPNSQMRALLPHSDGINTSPAPTKVVTNPAFMPTSVMRNLVGDDDKMKTGQMMTDNTRQYGDMMAIDRAREEAMRRAAREPNSQQQQQAGMATRQPRALVGQKVVPSQAEVEIMKQLDMVQARRPIMKAGEAQQPLFSGDPMANRQQLDNLQRAIFGRDSGGQAGDMVRLLAASGAAPGMSPQAQAGGPNISSVQALLLNSQLAQTQAQQRRVQQQQQPNSAIGQLGNIPTGMGSGGIGQMQLPPQLMQQQQQQLQQQQMLMQRFAVPPPPFPQQQQQQQLGNIRGLTPINQLTYMPGQQQAVNMLDGLRGTTPNQPGTGGQIPFGAVPAPGLMPHPVLGARSAAPTLSPGSLPASNMQTGPMPLWGRTT